MTDFYDTFYLVDAVLKEELGADITWIDPGKLAHLTVRLSELISGDD